MPDNMPPMGRLAHHLKMNMKLRLEWTALWGMRWETELTGRAHYWLAPVPGVALHWSWDTITLEKRVRVHVYNQEYTRLAVLTVQRSSSPYRLITRQALVDVPGVGRCNVLAVQPFGDDGADLYVAVDDPTIYGVHAPTPSILGTPGMAAGYASWDDFYDDYSTPSGKLQPGGQWGKQL